MLRIPYLIIFQPRDCPILVSMPFLIGFFFFLMPFSRIAQQADFASLEPLLSLLWEGCGHPGTSFLSLHVLIYLSRESVLKSAVNRSRVPLASDFSLSAMKEPSWRSCRRAVTMHNPLAGPCFSLSDQLQSCFFHAWMVLTERGCFDLRTCCIRWVFLKMYFICILIVGLKKHKHELLRILTWTLLIICFGFACLLSIYCVP